MQKRILIGIIIFTFILTVVGCRPDRDGQFPEKKANATGDPIQQETHIQPVEETQTVVPSIYTPSATPNIITDRKIKLWICDCLPSTVLSPQRLPNYIEIEESSATAELQITPIADLDAMGQILVIEWIYALVAPFPTVDDDMGFNELKNVWLGRQEGEPDRMTILVSAETALTFEYLWGKPSAQHVKIDSAENILKDAWNSVKTWAIIPFEELDPRWKVIKVAGQSPLERSFNPDQYPLTAHFAATGNKNDLEYFLDFYGSQPFLTATNREEEKLTSLIMTGTTALVRYTALKIEENGINYPGEGIVEILKAADLTHISNEVPFYEDCPPANPVRVEQRFCSDPSYFELFKYIGVDIIELTGNHILDWGVAPLLFTIDMYNQTGIPYFGGGTNLEDARKTLLLEKNENLLAFLGCSPAGPEVVWATNDTPGSNPCDFDFLTEEMRRVEQLGYLPVMTFQHLEVEDYYPHSSQRTDFVRAAEMGAVIVSGSQSHFAQTMTFVGDHFVHYGLGNLFFDQMYGENPREFIDRHYFYDGRYISTELVTTMLEDASRPRLMNSEERAEFLQTIFDKCFWDTAFPER